MIKFTFHMKTYQIYKEFSRVTCSAAFYIVCDDFIFLNGQIFERLTTLLHNSRKAPPWPIYTVHGWYRTWNPYNDSNPNLLY